jgi:hypothetical protein
MAIFALANLLPYSLYRFHSVAVAPALPLALQILGAAAAPIPLG